MSFLSHVLITGGSGFLGTHLAKKLISEGTQVDILDLAEPKVSSREYIKGDVRDSALLTKYFLKNNPEAIFHFAATVNIARCQENANESYSNNVLSTVHLLSVLKELNKTQTGVVFASSASVYGKIGKINTPIKESETSTTFESYYAAQKMASEQALTLFNHFENIPVSILRFFNIYGEGQDPHSPYSGVLSIFLKKLLENKNLTIFGDGSFTRDFISVHDVAQACILAAKKDKKFWSPQPMNIGSGECISILELAKLCIKTLESKNLIEFAPERAGDLPHSRADITEANRRLGFKPQVSLQSGIQTLVKSLA